MVRIQNIKLDSWFSTVGVFACLVFAGRLAVADPPDTWFGQHTQPQQRRDLQLHASASCSATACHGGPRAGVTATGAVRGSEYPLWLSSDPHARSWRTLCSDKSVAILNRLEILKNGHIADQAGFDNCLACHNSTQHFQESRTTERITEGIGCSSCHGPDQLWHAAHLERDWSPSAQLASGFAQTKNLLSRARLCASCHVGDRDRDMNHDIIAAGHPALHYEFATYQRRQPKHWRSGKTPKEDDEAYAWLVGQLASLDAFLTLLESRARTSHRESQWPELAVFDCSSCHQQLTNETYQLPARTNSSPTLSNWHRFGVQKFLNWRSQQPTFSSTDQELLEALMDLERTVKSPTVDALTAQQAAQRARRALDRWITSRDGQLALSSFDAEKLHEMVSAAGMDQSASSSWEAAAQFYLASITAREKWSDLSHQPNRGETVLETSRRLREALQFQGNSATPKNRFGDFGDNAINAPGPQSVRAHWQSLQKTISIDQVEGPR